MDVWLGGGGSPRDRRGYLKWRRIPEMVHQGTSVGNPGTGPALPEAVVPLGSALVYVDLHR
jgi:hypothetical protein